MSDDNETKAPIPFPHSEAAADALAAEHERARKHTEMMLDLAVRHLYGTALTLCRLTGGNMSDVPRLLVAAGAHSVQSLIEKLAIQQKRIDELGIEDLRRGPMIGAANTMAGDLEQTMGDFERALLEALGNMKTLREGDDEAPAANVDIEPGGSAPVH